MKRLGVLCLTLALALGLAGCVSREAQESSPTPTVEPAPVLAYFGSSAEPWDKALRAAVLDWCAQTGWELVEYDCLGLAETQTVQIEDLKRDGGADMALLCAVGRDSLADGAMALSEEGAMVITLADIPLELPQGALCHLCPGAPAIYQAAAGFLLDEPVESEGAVILHDVETDPLEMAALRALEDVDVRVVEETYTWGNVDFARAFLVDALGRHSRVGGVLCFSRTGTQGARLALRETGAEEVKILCLDCNEELLADLEQGKVDGLLTLDAEGAAADLQAALTQVAAGKQPGSIPLAVTVLTQLDV